MILERILPDEILTRLDNLGNASSDVCWAMGGEAINLREMVQTIQDNVEDMGYPKATEKEIKSLGLMDINRFLAERFGKTDRRIRDYIRISTKFPPEKRHDNLHFAHHEWADGFDNSEEILEIAERRMAQIGKPPSVDWLKANTLDEERREEVNDVLDMEEAMSAAAYHFLTQFKRFLQRLTEVLVNSRLEESKIDRAREIMQELYDILDEVKGKEDA